MQPPTTQARTVALVNDHEVVVRGLRAMLEPYADRLQVVELDSRTEVLTPVDIALYDTFSMDGSEQPVLEDLLASPRVGVVAIYTWNLDRQQVRAARARGVRSLISKALDASHLASALERVGRGESVIDPPVDDDEDPVAGSWPGRECGLTAREAEVVSLIVQGLSNAEIAERTYLSINSVKSYIRTAYRTMGVTTRSRAVRWGIDHGLDPQARRVILPPDPNGILAGSPDAPRQTLGYAVDPHRA